MNYIKNSLFIIFLLTAFSAAASNTESLITVKKIKLEIGEHKYIWENGLPGAGPDAVILPETVLSFTSLNPGLIISEAKLNREVKLFEARLIESGLFYSASTAVIPPKKYPDMRTIAVRVKPGFLMRFGGGLAYGYIGSKTITGARKEWGITAGANTAGINLVCHNLFNRGFYLNPQINYENHLLRDAENPYHQFTLNLDTGKYFTPDILAGIGASVETDLLSETEGSPDFKYMFSGFAAFNLPRTEVLSADLKLRTPVILTGSEIIPSFFALGTLSQAVSLFSIRETAAIHYLWGSRDSSMLKDYVRTLPENVSLFTSAEAGITAIDCYIFSIFHMCLDFFCFGEVGSISSFQAGFSPLKYGTGAGIDLVFKEPVFVTLELYFNINNTETDGLQFQVKGDF